MKAEVLCDNDVVSALAKADEIELLKLIFPKHEFFITEYVRDELDRSKQEGFDFPKIIFEFCTTTTLNQKELEMYESIESLEVSKTDIKNLIIAKNRNIPLLTNDSKLYDKCRKKDVKVHDLRQIIKTIYNGDLMSEANLRTIIAKIEKRDNTKIKNKEDLLTK